MSPTHIHSSLFGSTLMANALQVFSAGAYVQQMVDTEASTLDANVSQSSLVMVSDTQLATQFSFHCV